MVRAIVVTLLNIFTFYVGHKLFIISTKRMLDTIAHIVAMNIIQGTVQPCRGRFGYFGFDGG